MGQYYRGVVLGKTTKKSKKIIVKQAFCCYAHGNGAKLMEHSYVGNWYVKEYEYDLANEFYGYPFVWAGDYADEMYNTSVYEEACKYIRKQATKNARKMGYRKVKDPKWFKEYEKNGVYASESEMAVNNKDVIAITYKYIINFDKKVFVRIPEKKGLDENGHYQLTIHPLPLLCADGNQRGGGDYYGTNETLVGSWAYDRIGVSDELPEDITTELVVTFEESWCNSNKKGDNFTYVEHK